MKLDNFLLPPPASFVNKDSDVLMILGKTAAIKKIKAKKQGEVVLMISLLLLKPGWILVEVDGPTTTRR